MLLDNTLKWSNPKLTAKGKPRAWVTLKELKTLWFNTGSKCNLTCENCYMESTPTNDRLSFLNLNDVLPFLKEAHTKKTKVIGFTGGEPFLNPHFIDILKITLAENFETLVLTNAYHMMNRYKKQLIELKNTHSKKLSIRVSLDHYTKELHEKERGEKTFDESLKAIHWLVENGFNTSIAGRSLKTENSEVSIKEYRKLIPGINQLVVFPEMDMLTDAPEITVDCWNILDVNPDAQMCSSERMVVKKQGATQPTVLPCTLLTYDAQFELGPSLAAARKNVYLNHRFCSQFCVLGGASCSAAK